MEKRSLNLNLEYFFYFSIIYYIENETMSFRLKEDHAIFRLAHVNRKRVIEYSHDDVMNG